MSVSVARRAKFIRLAWATPLLLLAISACARPPPPTLAETRRNGPLPSLLQLGDGLQRTGDTEGALALYRAAASQNGRDPVALERVGQALMAQGDPARAEQAFRAALTIDGQLGGAQSGRAAAVLMQGRVDEALPMLSGLANDRPSPQSLRAYGAALDMAGRQDDAQAAYRRGLALAPADANLHGNLALSLAAAGTMEEALDEMRLAEAAPLPDQRQDVNGVLLRAVAGRVREARLRGYRLLGVAQTQVVLRQAAEVRAINDPAARAMAFGLFTATGTKVVETDSPGPGLAGIERGEADRAAD